MMLQIILWASVGWLPILIAYMLVNETRFKKNIVIGVTLPYEAREDEEVQKVLKKFKQQTITACAVLMLVCIPCFFMQGESLIMTIWLLWLDVVIVVPYIPYVFTNMRLHEIKKQRGWDNHEQRTVAVNMEAIPGSTWFSPWVFLPSVLLCLIPILFDQELAMMYVLFAGICASFYFSYRYLYRNKTEMVDENTDLTIVLTRIRKYNWGKMWIVCSYAMSLYALSMCFFDRLPLLSGAVMILVSVFLCVEAFRIEFKTRHLQEKLTKDSGQEWYADEDDHWIWGMFYDNPDDDRLIINNRIGINSTVNLAKTAGKLLLGASVLLLALMPFTGVWMESMGSHEILMTAENEVFTVKAGTTTYTVNTSEIKEVTLLEELPSHLSRKMGTGMEHYLEGKFSADAIGNVTVLLDPTVSPYILIQTDSGKYYLFGSRKAETTRDAYEALKKLVLVEKKPENIGMGSLSAVRA